MTFDYIPRDSPIYADRCYPYLRRYHPTMRVLSTDSDEADKQQRQIL